MPKKTDKIGIPKALNDTHWSVVNVLHAISFEIAIATNIIIQSQVSLFHPAKLSLIEERIIYDKKFFLINWPIIKTKAIINDTIVGFIFMNISLSKIKVNPPNSTTAPHPKAASMGILLKYIHEITREMIVLTTKNAVPA